ncbi:MAG: shikimate dehydrogenase [Actinobacteria bacterium]|nr:shikimate dehydrogenase [Actinomycetota bacterium]
MRAAVLGRPVAHSLSPVLHRAAYAALDLSDWRYDAIDCGEADLARQLADSGPEWAGFSCTMPLKRCVVSMADVVDDEAAAIGAANTLLRHPAGGWRAAATDPIGIVNALADRTGAAVGARSAVTLLGAGGTAQNALAALRILGIDHCTVLVRSPERASALLDTATRLGLSVELAALDPTLDAVTAADLLISTLPAGAADQFADAYWHRDQILLDVVYDPWPTAIAAAAAGAGVRVVSGALMLLHQAAAQVALMTGRAAPVAAMRAALRSVTASTGI